MDGTHTVRMAGRGATGCKEAGAGMWGEHRVHMACLNAVVGYSWCVRTLDEMEPSGQSVGVKQEEHCVVDS